MSISQPKSIRQKSIVTIAWKQKRNTYFEIPDFALHVEDMYIPETTQITCKFHDDLTHTGCLKKTQPNESIILSTIYGLG